MIGGDYKERPFDYIERQLRTNSAHQDGSVENQDDLDSTWEWLDAVREHVENPASVLVLGCRTGYELRQLRRVLPQAHLAGVDIVPEFIERAQTTSRGDKLDFYLADIHKLPLLDQSFEVTVCSGTLEHLHDLPRGVGEMLRVTSKLLYVTADLADKMRGSDFAASSKPSEWLALFEREGWQLLKAWTAPGVLVPAGLYMIWGRT